MSTFGAVVVLGEPTDDRARTLAELVGGRLVHRGLELMFPRPHVVIVCASYDRLRAAAVYTSLARARAVIWLPTGAAPRPTWWLRRFHRFLLTSQDEARAWEREGFALGRLVVLPLSAWAAGPLGALVAEAAAMGGAPDRRQ